MMLKSYLYGVTNINMLLKTYPQYPEMDGLKKNVKRRLAKAWRPILIGDFLQ